MYIVEKKAFEVISTIDQLSYSHQCHANDYIVTRVLRCFRYLLLAIPEMESEAEHGSGKSPVAVQVKLNTPSTNFTVLVDETTAPLLSVHR